MIKIHNLSKWFYVYRRRRAMIKHALGLASEGRDYDRVISLNGINLNIEKGQVHGIIGMNGAGKSTMLKILTRVLFPSEGYFELKGRVAALLELGTGFHGELTGRENVMLNASIMGLSKNEINQKIPQIEEFCELNEFFDRPVKIYSSGMYVRLAFSFAVSVDPDVLIIDEALSVGDAYFQQKCLRKIEEFKNSGTTILFVSHDLSAVRRLCNTVTLLDKGRELFTGSPMQALDLYNALLVEFRNEQKINEFRKKAAEIQATKAFESGSGEIKVVKVVLLDDQDVSGIAFNSGQKIIIRVEAVANIDINDNQITCGILIRDRLGYDVFGTNTYCLGIKTPRLKAGQLIRWDFKLDLNIGPGDYVLTVALHSHKSHVEQNYHWLERAVLFTVLPTNDYEFIGVARLQPKVKATIRDH